MAQVNKKEMQIQVWSDIVCPWCYIGKRRLEAALARFEHRDQVEVVWRSFQLDSEAPQAYGTTVNEHLARKYGTSLEQAAAMSERVTQVAADEGLDFRFDIAHSGNTFDAHRLVHFAATQGLQDVTKERLMKAYFTEGAAIGDHETLVSLATELGLDEAEVRAVLQGGAYSSEVQADLQQARRLGINGVPFFVIDNQYGVSGAQPAEVLLEVLQDVWAKAHPLVKVGASNETHQCDDDNCLI